MDVSTCRFMGSLGQEGGDLPLLGGVVPSGAEGWERLGGGNKSVVRVEPLGGAASVVPVLEQLVEGCPRNQAAYVSTSTSSSSALALAAGGAVVGRASAPPVLAAAQASRAYSATGLRPALLSGAAR